MKKTLLSILVLGLLGNVGSVLAQENEEKIEQEEEKQEEVQVQNEDIIKTEIKIGHQYLSNHGPHLVAGATGEANILYNKYGHVQLLPFEVNIYMHYHGLSHVQLQNMKVTALNFMLDQHGFGIGAGMMTKENFGYRETQVAVTTISPVIAHAFHKVEFEDGKTVLKISGYMSVGKALGFGENTRYAFNVDGNHNGGLVIPAGASASINFNDKLELKGYVDYQHLQAKDMTNCLSLNEVKYGLTANLKLSEVLNKKLRGINLYANISNQHMIYKQSDKSVTLVGSTLSKQSYFNVQAGVTINLNKKATK